MHRSCAGLFQANQKMRMLSHENIHLYQQMQLPSVMPILVLVLEQSTYMLLAALEGRLTSLTAPKFAQSFTVCRATQKMLE